MAIEREAHADVGALFSPVYTRDASPTALRGTRRSGGAPTVQRDPLLPRWQIILTMGEQRGRRIEVVMETVMKWEGKCKMSNFFGWLPRLFVLRINRKKFYGVEKPWSHFHAILSRKSHPTRCPRKRVERRPRNSHVDPVTATRWPRRPTQFRDLTVDLTGRDFTEEPRKATIGTYTPSQSQRHVACNVDPVTATRWPRSPTQFYDLTGSYATIFYVRATQSEDRDLHLVTVTATRNWHVDPVIATRWPRSPTQFRDLTVDLTGRDFTEEPRKAKIGTYTPSQSRRAGNSHIDLIITTT